MGEPNHIPGSAEKKGAIRHAHPYYAIYRKSPPPPPGIPREQAASKKSLSENIRIYRDVRKVGAFHIRIQKIRLSHILFVENRGGGVGGPNHIPGSAEKKGAIRHAHPYYAIYRKSPPPPPPSWNTKRTSSLEKISE